MNILQLFWGGFFIGGAILVYLMLLNRFWASERPLICLSHQIIGAIIITPILLAGLAIIFPYEAHIIYIEIIRWLTKEW